MRSLKITIKIESVKLNVENPDQDELETYGFKVEIKKGIIWRKRETFFTQNITDNTWEKIQKIVEGMIRR